MARYNTTILKFNQKGEKTGWTYIEVPADIAMKLKTGKKSFRVKGIIDHWKFKGKALLPAGDGSFILALNAEARKGIGKREGAMVEVNILTDEEPYRLNTDFMDCLKEDPVALKFFNSLPGSHRNYFSKWIESAKSDSTKVKRIAQAVQALSQKLRFMQMMQAARERKNNL